MNYHKENRVVLPATRESFGKKTIRLEFFGFIMLNGVSARTVCICTAIAFAPRFPITYLERLWYKYF